MTKQAIIEHTIAVINQLPNDKAAEISDFADSVISQYHEINLSAAVNNFASGKSFDFLNDEEDIYSEADLKEKYDAER